MRVDVYDACVVVSLRSLKLAVGTTNFIIGGEANGMQSCPQSHIIVVLVMVKNVTVQSPNLRSRKETKDNKGLLLRQILERERRDEFLSSRERLNNDISFVLTRWGSSSLAIA